MSQAGIISVAGGGGGGSPIQTITGDSGGAVPPIGNNINLKGGSSTINNANGVTIVGNAGTATETVTLTNRLQSSGLVTTVGAVTADLITFPLGITPGFFSFQFLVSAFNASTPAGSQYFNLSGVRTTGAAAVLVSTQNLFTNGEAALAASNVTMVVSANNAILRVLGVAGLTIDWSTVGTYVEAN